MSTRQSHGLRWYAYGWVGAGAAVCISTMLTGAGDVRAQSIELGVVNSSFESPFSLSSGGVFPEADGWVETGPIGGDPPNFPGFEVPDGGPFTLDTGVFFNSAVVTNPTPPPDFLPNPAFVTNARDFQLAYLFARDDVDISFQQTLDLAYEAGTDFTLTVAVGRSFFLSPINVDDGPTEMAIRWTYANDEGELEVVSERAIDLSEVGDGTQVFDFSTSTDFLAEDHPAVGRDASLWIGPTGGTSGVWILDDVRARLVRDLVQGDMNGDGVKDAFDVAPFEVALADRAAYEAMFPGLNADRRGDHTGDGVLDAFDVSPFETIINVGGSTGTVPEPASAALFGLGLGALLSRRRGG